MPALQTLKQDPIYDIQKTENLSWESSERRYYRHLARLQEVLVSVRSANYGGGARFGRGSRTIAPPPISQTQEREKAMAKIRSTKVFKDAVDIAFGTQTMKFVVAA